MQQAKTSLTIAAIVLFLAGAGYIVYANRPVMQIRNAPEQANTAAPTTNAAAELSEPTNANAAAPETPVTNEQPAPVPEKPSSDNGGGTTAHTYTMADVSAHATQSSCWAAINDSVYDLTSWVSRHPGGPDKIIRLCGTDGTATFQMKHGGSSKAQAMLALLKIGTLK